MYHETNSNQPLWSIVVPSYNRAEALQHCVASLLAMNCEFATEIVVVEDGSTTRAKLPPQVRHLWQENAGPAAARNFGAREAQAERLAFIDDDCEVTPNWLSELDRSFAKDTVLGGHTLNALPENLWSQASQDVVDCLTKEVMQIAAPNQFVASNNLALSRTTFEKIGGFDETFPLAAGEDRAFCLRAGELGISFRKVQNAEVRHFHYLELWSFLRQHFNYGRGAFQVKSRFGNKADLRDRAWRAFIAYPASPGGKCSMALAQSATATGYLYEKSMSHE